MASFTASSICFSFKVCSRAEHLLLSAADQASAPFALKKLGLHCVSQQTASPLLDFSGRPHDELPITIPASSAASSSPSSSSSSRLPSLSSSSLIDSGKLWQGSDASMRFSTRENDFISSSSSPPGGLSVASLMEPVIEDLQILNRNLHTVVGSENPLLMAAAEQIFSAGGKRMRPALVLLASKATAQLAGLKDLNPQHRRLAEVIEMIHTASLIHDDVLDESAVRRGKETIHKLYGTRVAVLAGDFMFAQSSWYLATMENLQVIKLISQVIKDLASGEIKQASSLFDCDTTLEEYLEKSYYKTASLIAASTCSAAIFSGVGPDVCDKMFDYGLNLGLAFQVVDDILDFTRSTEELGKPAGSDLSKGNLTAPVLFSLEEDQELRQIIESEFTDDGSLEAAIARVRQGGGLERARALAKAKGDAAKSCLECLSPGPYRSSLEGMVDYVLDRLF